MEYIKDAIAWVSGHAVELVALGWALEKVLEIVSRLTPWKWDDNLGVLLANLLSKISKKPS